MAKDGNVPTSRSKFKEFAQRLSSDLEVLDDSAKLIAKINPREESLGYIKEIRKDIAALDRRRKKLGPNDFEEIMKLDQDAIEIAHRLREFLKDRKKLKSEMRVKNSPHSISPKTANKITLAREALGKIVLRDQVSTDHQEIHSSQSPANKGNVSR